MCNRPPSIMRFDEPVPPNGAVLAGGVRRLLGQPRLTPLQLLVRESMQNSWDARVAGKRVEVKWTVQDIASSDHARFEMLRGGPTGAASSVPAALAESQILLSVTDIHTVGLAGPTRADQHRPGERKNFVSFVRNVGQHTSEGGVSGGTYGFGKSSFFRASLCGAVLVFSRVSTPQAKSQARFIGCMLGEPTSTLPLLTGRSWWGRIEDGVAEPLLDDEAEEAAKYFGVPTVDVGTTGTTVSIIAPRFHREDTTHQQRAGRIGDDLREAVLWNFWPKLTSSNDHGLDCAIVVNGRSVPLPDPAKHRKLKWFVEAFKAAKAGKSSESIQVATVASARPRMELGVVAIAGPAPFLVMPGLGSTELDTDEPIGDRMHHVALMRAPELVVTYRSYEAPLDERLHFAGVFIASRQVDDAFAAAEPPSHDDWNAGAIEDTNTNHWRTYVRVAERRIQEMVDTRNALVAPQIDASGGAAAFGALSQELGHLIAGATGDGPSPKKTKGGAGGGRQKVRVGSEPTLAMEGRRIVATLSVEVLDTGTAHTLIAKGGVLLAGGMLEKEPPEGASGVAIIGWRSVGSEVRTEHDKATLHFVPGMPSRWEIRFEVPRDAAVSLGVDA